jgi:Zn-dependent protease/CBS domain-containing protein
MSPTLRIGRIAGVEIGVNWSWLIVFALIVWTLAANVFPAQNPGLGNAAYAAMAFAAALLFFASLLLHELGHTFQARREGVEIEGITLWLFGGVARLKGAFPSAWSELRIALAGPAVSAVLGMAFLTIAELTRAPEQVNGVAAWLGYINLVLLAFNLLPALPLDGGRVLHALLWRVGGNLARATRRAAGIGRGFGLLLVGIGVASLAFGGGVSGLWLAFIGWFLFQAATAEARSYRFRAALAGLRVRDVMVRRPVTVDAGATLAEFMDQVAYAHRYTTYPVLEDGRVVGLLPFRSVAVVPRGKWDRTHVRDCMLPLATVSVVREESQLLDVLDEMGDGGMSRALVLEDGELEGLLSMTDVLRMVAWKGAGQS